jgi:hypothetical protein
MNQTRNYSPKDAHVEIQERQVVLVFPNRPAVNFSLDIPDLRCAGYSPAYTYKAWMWCAYVNALHAAQIQLGYERNHELFRHVWRKIKSSRRG